MQRWCIALVSVFLAACQDTLTTEGKQQGLVYCLEANPVSFNPQVTTTGSTIDVVAKQLYNRLLRIDSNTGELQPELARRWEISPDGTQITFYLRDDVAFHHTDYFTPTRLLNADDVVFSFRRIFDVYNNYHFVGGGSYPYFQSIGFDQLIKNVEKLDNHTVRFELFNPESAFLTNIATDFAVVLSAEYAAKLEKNDAKYRIDTHPIGTGPYQFKDYRRDVLVRMYPNIHYWQGNVALNQLVYDITPNGTTRVAKMLTKECDVMANPSASQVSILAKRDDIRIEKAPNLNTGYWAFNTERRPFNDPLVRRALSHAINLDKIMQAVYRGHGEKARSMLPPSAYAFSAQTLPNYDPNEAIRLLEQAGYPEGFEMDIWAMPVSRLYNPNARKMAELMQADLDAIGVKVRIVEYEWNTFLRKLGEHLHDSVLIGWAADTPDADNFFSPLLSCAAAINGKNPANWCHPDFDLVLAKALATTDTQERKALYGQAQRMLAEQMPLLPIAHGLRFQAAQKNVAGIELMPFGGVSLANARQE